MRNLFLALLGLKEVRLLSFNPLAILLSNEEEVLREIHLVEEEVRLISCAWEEQDWVYYRPRLIHSRRHEIRLGNLALELIGLLKEIGPVDEQREGWVFYWVEKWGERGEEGVLEFIARGEAQSELIGKDIEGWGRLSKKRLWEMTRWDRDNI